MDVKEFVESFVEIYNKMIDKMLSMTTKVGESASGLDIRLIIFDASESKQYYKLQYCSAVMSAFILEMTAPTSKNWSETDFKIILKGLNRLVSGQSIYSLEKYLIRYFELVGNYMLMLLNTAGGVSVYRSKLNVESFFDVNVKSPKGFHLITMLTDRADPYFDTFYWHEYGHCLNDHPLLLANYNMNTINTAKSTEDINNVVFTSALTDKNLFEYERVADSYAYLKVGIKICNINIVKFSESSISFLIRTIKNNKWMFNAEMLKSNLTFVNFIKSTLNVKGVTELTGIYKESMEIHFKERAL